MFSRALRAETSLAGALRSARSPSMTISSPRSTTTSVARFPLRPRPLSTSCPRCSGHNRWSKIRHRKGAADAQKSALFSKLINDVHMALKAAGGSGETNPRVQSAITKARDGGVPKSAIEAALARTEWQAKAAADGSGQTVTYEAVGPGGKGAIIVECITDNPSRTFARVREVLTKNGCRVAPVSYLFEKKGVIAVKPIAPQGTFDHLFDISLEHGAEDVKILEDEGEGEVWEVYLPPGELSGLNRVLTKDHLDQYEIQSSELAWVPNEPLEPGEDGEMSEERAEGLMKTVELLEEEGDVLQVWTNLA